MKRAYADSIAHVKKLYEGDEDVLHNYSHSQRVAALCRHIAQNINYKDLDLVELIGIWHDAARTQGEDKHHEEAGAKMARDDLLDRGVSEKTADTVYRAIRSHSHSKGVPVTNIEGQILKEADKLEIFTVERWKACAEAGWTDYYKREIRKSYANIDNYLDAFTFDYTKKLFKKRLAEFKTFYASIMQHLD